MCAAISGGHTVPQLNCCPRTKTETNIKQINREKAYLPPQFIFSILVVAALATFAVVLIIVNYNFGLFDERKTIVDAKISFFLKCQVFFVFLG